MSDGEILTLLDRAGVTALLARDPRATLRPLDETQEAPAKAPSQRPPRELPVISVDVRTAPSTGRMVLDVGARSRDLEIRSLLGQGGMGRVFLARQHSLDRDVAIKTLHEDAPAAQRRTLLEEGAVTGFLEHPSIIPVHAMGVDASDRPVLVMKRVEGVSWLALIRDPEHAEWAARGADPRRRLDDHLEILQQVCNAAHFAHSRGVVHRDIKPENVLIGRFGDVYLADWGIAYRLDPSGSPSLAGVCGTPAYMAPEMVLGEPIDAQTDVYLLGATLHEVLTGTARHVGATPRAMLTSILASPPCAYDPAVPPALAVIANRATARDPKDRYATAAELRQALSDYLRHRSSMAFGASALSRMERLSELIGQLESRTREDAQREIDLLIAETRFGLTQALSEWSGNDAAARGLERLEALLVARRARAAELERLAQDLDPSVAARQRLLGGAAMVLAGLVLSVVTFARGIDFQPTAAELVRESVGPCVALAAAAIALRKSFLRSAINRRALLYLGTLVSLVLLGRLVGLRSGAEPAQMLAQNAMVGVAIAIVAAATTFRWLAFLGAIMAVTAVACVEWPARAAFSFAVGSGASLLVMLAGAWRGDSDARGRA